MQGVSDRDGTDAQVFSLSIASFGRFPDIRRLAPTWSSEVCNIMAFRAVVECVGPVFYVLFGPSRRDTEAAAARPQQSPRL